MIIMKNSGTASDLELGPKKYYSPPLPLILYPQNTYYFQTAVGTIPELTSNPLRTPQIIKIFSLAEPEPKAGVLQSIKKHLTQ